MSKIFIDDDGSLIRLNPRNPVPEYLKPLIDVNYPQAILIQGERGGGKGVAVDYFVEKWYKAWITIFHCWASKDYENFFYPINRNCQTKRAGKILDENPELKKEFVGCVCNRSIPMVMFVPDYYDIDQRSLDEFNGFYWKSIEEYKEAYAKGIVNQVIEKEEFEREIKGTIKPEQLRPKPLIIVIKFTVPSTDARKDLFKKDLYEAIKTARWEHRIISMNPAMFTSSRDRYKTLAAIFSLTKDIKEDLLSEKESDIEKRVEMPRQDWHPREKSWNKIAFVINELGSVAPTQKLSKDTSSIDTKRAIMEFFPEARHRNAWFIADYQNPEDIYSSVIPLANFTIMKKSSRKLAGDGWKWFFDLIDDKRQGLIEKFGYTRGKSEADRDYPKIDDLPVDMGYVIWNNGQHKKWKFPMPSFHHKETMEDFNAITGIKWQVNKTIAVESQESPEEQNQHASVREKKVQKEQEYMQMFTMREKNKDGWDDIIKYFVELYDGDDLNKKRWEKETSKNLSNKYNSWKKKQFDKETQANSKKS